jgi:hypothetical protein
VDLSAAGLFAVIGLLFPAAVTLLNFESNRLMGPNIAGAVLTVRGNTLRESARDDRILTAFNHLEVGGPGAHGVWLFAQREPHRKECVMRLTSAEVERTLSQFEAQVIPDNHPVVPQLYELFGDHTFFLDSNGLNIVEPAEPTQAGTQAGKVVILADWSDANDLAPHEPEPTDVVIVLGFKH